MVPYRIKSLHLNFILQYIQVSGPVMNAATSLKYKGSMSHCNHRSATFGDERLIHGQPDSFPMIREQSDINKAVEINIAYFSSCYDLNPNQMQRHFTESMKKNGSIPINDAIN